MPVAQAVYCEVPQALFLQAASGAVAMVETHNYAPQPSAVTSGAAASDPPRSTPRAELVP